MHPILTKAGSNEHGHDGRGVLHGPIFNKVPRHLLAAFIFSGLQLKGLRGELGSLNLDLTAIEGNREGDGAACWPLLSPPRAISASRRGNLGDL